MPRCNRRGQVAAGNGAEVTVDGVVIAPLGTAAQWLDDDRIIYQAGHPGDRWTIETCVPGRTPETVSDRGCNELAAGGGRWIAFLDGVGLFGAIELPAAGVSPTTTDGRGAAGPDGTLAVVPNRQAGDLLELHSPAGVQAIIRPAVYGLQVLGPQAAVWAQGAVGVPVPALLPGASNLRRVVAPDGVPWWVYWTDATGLIAHPTGSFVAAVLEPRPRAFHPDAVVVGGQLLVTYATGSGEHPGEIVTVDAWSLPRVDLGGPPPVVVSPPPIVVHPPPTKEPPVSVDYMAVLRQVWAERGVEAEKQRLWPHGSPRQHVEEVKELQALALVETAQRLRAAGVDCWLERHETSSGVAVRLRDGGSVRISGDILIIDGYGHDVLSRDSYGGQSQDEYANEERVHPGEAGGGPDIGERIDPFAVALPAVGPPPPVVVPPPDPHVDPPPPPPPPAEGEGDLAEVLENQQTQISDAKKQHDELQSSIVTAIDDLKTQVADGIKVKWR